MKNIKLVLTDLDGTFVGRDHLIHPDNISMVKKLKENGILFGIATGRPFPGALALVNSLELLDYVDYFITTNGLEYWDVKRDVKFTQGLLSLDQIKLAMQLTDEFDCAYLVVEDGKVRTTKITEFSALEGSINKLEMFEKSFDSEMDDAYPKMICAAHEDVVIGMDEKLSKIDKSFDAVISHKNFFEILNFGVSKGSMVKKICAELKIDKSQVVGLGDNNNDETLITESGYGIAVANATDLIKSKAQIVSSKTASEGAFAFELEKLIWDK